MNETYRGAREKLWPLVSKLGSFERIDSLADLATNLWESNNKAEAIQVGLELIESLDKNFLDSNRINCTIRISTWMTDLGRFDESKALIDETLRLTSFSYDSLGVGLLHWKQVENLREKQSPEEKITYLISAAKCLIDEDKEILGAVKYELGAAYLVAGKYELAMQELTVALTNLEEAACTEMVCMTQQSLAELYIEIKELEQSKVFAADSLAVASFLKNEELIQTSNLLLARVASKQGIEKLAEQYFEKATYICGSSEFFKIAAKASFYQAIHWIDNSQTEKGISKLRDLIPVLKSTGHLKLSIVASELIGKTKL